jgi:acetyltransferase-like isoleucine patch superfamily enzyme
MDYERNHRRSLKNYLPWTETPEDVAAEQEAYQEFLREHEALTIGEGAYVSPDAVVTLSEGRVGAETYIASGAIVRGDVEIGAHCSVNPYANVAGEVTIGDGVRIASTAGIWGMNHQYADPDRPIYEQGLEHEGIEVEDDVWIGAGAQLLDGTSVGAHSVVGAGAVVTSDVEPYSIVGGNPARTIGDRRDSQSVDDANGGDLSRRLESFSQRVEDQLDTVLEYYRTPDGEGFLDQPGADPTVRAWCDAIEIAGSFDRLPPGFERAELVSHLQGLQDPETGLIPDPRSPPDPDADPTLLPGTWQPYNILSVGYALEVLESTFEHRIQAVDDLTPDRLYTHLEGLPWAEEAWHAGSWIDHYATGLYFNHRYFDGDRSPASLFGWLATAVDPETGLWGEPTASEEWLQPVNGFYRLTRGTYAQFGVVLPHPESAIDTVLRHSTNEAFFAPRNLNACNVLDVVHPLWLCGKQTDHRRDEARAWARSQIDTLLGAWHDDRGFAFELENGAPSLQGTEMWLSILYLLASVCDHGDSLTYEPNGVHRTDVALPLDGPEQ